MVAPFTVKAQIVADYRKFAQDAREGISRAMGEAGKAAVLKPTVEVPSVDKGKTSEVGREIGKTVSDAARRAIAKEPPLTSESTRKAQGEADGDGLKWGTRFCRGIRDGISKGISAAMAPVVTESEKVSAKAAAATARASSSMTSSMAAVVRTAKLAAAAVGTVTVAGATWGLKAAGEAEQADIAFSTMLQSAEKAKAFLADLTDFAARTPFEMPQLTKAASSLISIGIETEKIIPIMTTLGNVTSGMGTGSEGIRRATVALQQMNAAQKISAEDLNQLRDAGVPVFDLLTAATGKTKEEIAEMSKRGKLGAQELEQLMSALETGKGLDRFNGLMERQSESLFGRWSTLKDNMGMGLAKAVDPAIPLIKKALEKAGAAVEDWAPRLAERTAQFVSWVEPAYAWVKENVGPTLAYIGDGFRSVITDTKAFFTRNASTFRDAWSAIVRDLTRVRDLIGSLGRKAGEHGVTFRAIGDAIGATLQKIVDHKDAIAETYSVSRKLAPPILAAVAAYKLVGVATGPVLAMRRAMLALRTGTALAAAAQWALTLAQKASPVGLVIAAIAALAVALVGLYRHNQKFRQIVDTAWGGIKTAIGAVVTWVTDTALPWLSEAWESISGGAVAAKDAVVDAWNAMGSGISGAWSGLKDRVSGAWTSVTDGASAAKDSVVGIWDGLKDRVGGAWDTVKGGASAAADKMRQVGERIADAYRTVVWGVTMAAKAVMVVGLMIREGIDWVTEKIQGFLAKIWARIWEVIGPGIIELRDGIAAGWARISEVTTTAWRALRDALVQTWASIKDAVTGTWSAVSETTSRIWGTVKDTVTGAVSRVTESISGAWSAVAETTSQAWSAVRDRIAAAWQGITDLLSAGLTWARDVVTGTWTAVSETTSRIWGAVRDAIAAAWEGITSALRVALQWVTDTMAGAWDAAYTKASQVWEAISTAIRDAMDAVKGTISSGVQAIGKIWDQLKSMAAKPISFVINTVLGGLARKFNELSAKIDGPQLPVPSWTYDASQGFASGGRIPGMRQRPGVDNRIALVDGRVPVGIASGEWVIKNSSVAKYGDDVMASVNAGTATIIPQNGYAEGGMVWEKLAGWVRSNLPGAIITSTYRPGSVSSSGFRDYHSTGHAIDIGGGIGLMDAFNRIAAAFPNSAELIYSPAGGRQLKNGKPLFYGEPVRSEHFDHVHWAMRALDGAGGGFGIGGWVKGQVARLFEPFVNGLVGQIPETPMIWGLMRGIAKTASQAAIKKLLGLDDSKMMTGSDLSAAPVGAGVERWRGVVSQALDMLGQPAGLADTVLRRMNQESGGNARAVNGWDSNARAGTPSRGLMQVIDPTFRAYAMPGYGNIWDPLSNILASMRYAMFRYGSLSAAYNRAGGYAEGGMVASSQLWDAPVGSVHRLPQGVSMIHNRTGGEEYFERVDRRAGRGVYIERLETHTSNAREVMDELAWAVASSRLNGATPYGLAG